MCVCVCVCVRARARARACAFVFAARSWLHADNSTAIVDVTSDCRVTSLAAVTNIPLLRASLMTCHGVMDDVRNVRPSMETYIGAAFSFLRCFGSCLARVVLLTEQQAGRERSGCDKADSERRGVGGGGGVVKKGKGERERREGGGREIRRERERRGGEGGGAGYLLMKYMLAVKHLVVTRLGVKGGRVVKKKEGEREERERERESTG